VAALPAGAASLKVPGGKLVKARVEVEGGKVKEVRVTGDFFAHPEESIKELEGALAELDADSAAVRKAVLNFFASKDVTLVGATPSDFADVIASAVEAALSG
jgi:lipoate-protein ligase A